MGNEPQGYISQDGMYYIQVLPDGSTYTYLIDEGGNLIATDGPPDGTQATAVQGQDKYGDLVNQAQDYYDLYEAGSTASDVGAAAPVINETVATAYPATEAALGFEGARDAGLMYDAAGQPIGTAVGDALGSGSGILGQNGATLGSAGVGLAGTAVAAYYAWAAQKALANIMAKEQEKKNQGWVEAAALSNPMTAWTVPVVGGAFDLFDTGKPEDQQQRDKVRGSLKEGGFFDEGDKNYKVTLSDGTTFDWGKDGAARLRNLGQNIDGKGDRGYYDVDFSNQNSARTVGLLNPLGEAFGAGDDKRRSDFTGYMTNTVQQGGGTDAQIRELYARAGINSRQDGEEMLRSLVDRGGITEDEYKIYANGLDEVFQQGAYSRGRKPSQGSQPPKQSNAANPGGMSSGPIYKPDAKPLPNAPQVKEIKPQTNLIGRPTPQAAEQLRSGGLNRIAGISTKPVKKPVTYIPKGFSVRTMMGMKV